MDVLVCNAGIVHTAKVVDTSTDEFRRVIDFNLTAPFVQAREALPYLRQVKGNIVFISSDSGDIL